MRTRLVVVALALGVAVSCEPSFSPPIEGTLQVSVTTVGGDFDVNGYSLRVDGGAEQAVDVNQTVLLTRVDTGSHQVELGGVAGNCTVGGANPRSTRVPLGDTGRVTFAVGCVATGVLVSAATTGIDLDPDGYGVSVDGAPAVPVGVNGSVSITRLTAGGHTVAMSDVAANCPVGGTNPRTVTIAAGEVQPVSFAVACGAVSGIVEVTSQTAGIDVDANGYTVQLDNGTSQPLTVNGFVRFNGVPGGDHQLTLGGVAGNCPVGASNPRTVSVATGGPTRDTARTTFQVTCGAATARIEVTAATTGIDLDPNGYTVQVDGGTAVPLVVNGTVGFDGLSAGDHIVTLAGAAGNCPVGGSNPRTISVSTGGATRDTARTTFQLACTAVTGRIEVTAATTGVDLDADGYTVQVDGAAPVPVAANGTVAFDGLSGGDHSVTLAGVAANCPVSGLNPRTLTVTTGGATRDTARTTFQMPCTATTGRIEVTAATTGLDPAPNGYTVSVDGGTAFHLDVNGTRSFDGESGGAHQVTLAGATSNCTVGGLNPRSVTVTTGGATRDTARTTFDVSCVATTGAIEVTAATSGPDQDANGYTVRVDNLAPVSLPTNGASTILGITVGSHSVLLDGVAGNCSISGANPRMVSVTAGTTTRDTARTTYTLTCAATTGSIAVTATTAGVDPDTNGYFAHVFSTGVSDGVHVSSNGTATLSSLLPGAYTVRLDDVTVNCSPDQVSRSATVAVGQTTSVSFAVTCAAAGTLAFRYFVAGNADVYLIKSNGGGLTRLTTDPATDAQPTWAPGNAKIAFTSYRDGNNGQIYVMNADGSGQVRLTNTAGGNANPSWSPDGTKIAFMSWRDGQAEIYVMNADGSNVVRLTNDPAYDADPAWSPDGTKIAFESGRAGDTHIFVMNANGSNVTQLSHGSVPESQPDWSPDGAKIAFSGGYCDYYYCYNDIFVMNADGSGSTRLTTTSIASQPAWSPDGSLIAFTDSYCDYYSCTSTIAVIRADGTGYTPVIGDASSDPAWRR